MSRTPHTLSNDRDDTHDRYTTSLRRRQRSTFEQVSAYYTQLHDYSRPSSSSGTAHSGSPSLKRRARFDTRPSTLRSSSVDSPTRAQAPSSNTTAPSRHSSHRHTSHHRALSESFITSTPHPALRVSNRTKAAIRYVVEEAIRKPKPFTLDLLEEHAKMSGLTGRAANGSSGLSGPTPINSGTSSGGIRPPTEIMRARNAREAQRQAEQQKEQEQRRLQEERRRRESAERRATGVTSQIPRYSASSSQYTPEAAQQPFDLSRSGSGRVAASEELGVPTGRTAQDYPASRTRGPSVTQQDQPRPAPAATSSARRPQQSQSAQRQPGSSAGATGVQSQQQSQSESSAPRGGASSFPHAFERWETLSSHWEGLTSFWIRKLEQNTEQIRDTIPNAATLNRQITDLSAAGANLFHAVVELQRLRASSERKFQRWFFETRESGEKSKEMQAQMENQLKQEKSAREESGRQRAEAAIQAENARREVAEMRRELMISKDEARRAWEELGRRNQESLEVAQSLKDGRVTLVHGVQVVPYIGGPSRSASASQRGLSTRDGGQPYYGGGAGGGGFGSPGDEEEAEYYYQQEASPTNTDPFMESGPTVQPLHPDHSKQRGEQYQPDYQMGRGTPTTSSTAQTAIPSGTQPPPPTRVTTQDAQRFYQHAPQDVFLHSPQSPAREAVGGAAAPATRGEVQSEASYVDTLSEGGTEYALDADGNIQYDSNGRPIILGRSSGGRPRADTTETTDTDDWNTEADVRREQELSARYGTSPPVAGQGVPTLLPPPEAPAAPSTSAQAMATYTPTAATTLPDTSGGLRPDYEGSGYGGGSTWETLMPTRHHHPTRLSDVLEEEEERSSRRTGE